MKNILKKIVFSVLIIMFLTSCGQNEKIVENKIQLKPRNIEIIKEIKNETNNQENMSESTRHHEWVEVDNNGKTIYTWVVYPEVSEKSPIIILIHENKGLTDWVKDLADKVADEGYIAVAPDLLSSFDETHKKTSDFASEDEARDAIYTLKSENVISDLKAVESYTQTISAGNGKLVSAGFCWGGSQSFLFATKSQNLSSSLVFYGTAPTDETLYENIQTPIYGFYGGNDMRVNATLEQTEKFMNENGKTFEYKIYDGAGHAYMRLGEVENPDESNKKARDESWERMKEILKGL